jgi:hypothetical protein
MLGEGLVKPDMEISFSSNSTKANITVDLNKNYNVGVKGTVCIDAVIKSYHVDQSLHTSINYAGSL